MRCRHFLLLAAIVFGADTAARAGNDPPDEACDLVRQFQRDADAIRDKAEQDVGARKDRLLRDLIALRDKYAKAGKFDEALAVHERLRDMQCPRQVEVEWNGTWWAAEVLKADGARFFIHYTGWDDHWNEWVTKDRIRPAGACPPGTGIGPRGRATLPPRRLGDVR